MIEFLELRACSVRIKGRHALKWGMCSNSNTEQLYSGKAENKRWFLASGTWLLWSRWLGSASTVYSILR